MPKLTWIGKEKVINHDRDVPYRVLKHKYGFENGVQTEKQSDSENKIIHGDNLEALKSLLPQYEGKIKCIYIDPPYNTGNENWVYNDNVNDPKIKKWLNEVVGKEGEDLSRHDKWLCMMYPRLKLLHKLLADDGVILISIGDDEIYYLVLICNEIFGLQARDASFVWKSRTKPTNAGNSKYRPQKVTEYVLLYSKTKGLLFNTQTGEDNYNYPNEDEDGKYRTSTILTSNLGSYQRETMRFEIANFTPPSDQRWKAGENIIQDLYDNNRLSFNNGIPMQKIYDYDNEEVNRPLYTLIKQELTGTAESGKTLLNKIIGMGHKFDTVKPIQLLNYLLEVFTDKSSIILDSFAGSGTTAHAVLNLNKADGGNRKFILIEMEDYAESITAERVKRVINGYAKTEGTGGAFNYFELGEPLFNAENLLNPNISVEVIKNYVWYSETRGALPTVNTANDNMYFLGALSGTAYYFYYELASVTTLDDAFLETVRTAAENYIMYADRCTLSAAQLEKYKIIFKKIPRDISRF